MVAAPDAARRETRRPEERETGEKQAPSTREAAILKEIQMLRDLYGQKGTRDARDILFGVFEEFLKEVEQWTREVRVMNALEKVKRAAE